MSVARITDVPQAGQKDRDPRPVWEQRIGWLFPKEGWLTYLVLILSLQVVVWSVYLADWVATPSLAGVMIWSTLLGLGLSRLRIHGVLLNLLALVIGVLLIVWLASGLAEGASFLDRLQDLAQRSLVWWRAVMDGGISADLLPLGLLLTMLAWLIGYAAAWSVFRFHNVWGAIIPAGIALVTNLSYLPPRMYAILFVYLFFAALLLVRMHSFERQRRWEKQQTEYPAHHSYSALFDAATFALLVFLVAATFPARPAVSETLRTVWIEGRAPMTNLETEFNRLFSQVPSRKETPLKQFGAHLPFMGPLNNTDQPVFTVEAEFPTYWRSRVYSHYTSAGWIGEKLEQHLLPWIPSLAQPAENRSRVELAQRITPQFPVAQLPMGSTPIASQAPADIEVMPPKSYTLTLGQAGVPADTPADLRRSLTDLNSIFGSLGAEQLTQTLLQTLPEGVVVTSLRIEGGRTARERDVSVTAESDQQYPAALRKAIPAGTYKLINVQVQRKQPYPPDVVAFISKAEVQPNQQYVVTSLVSVASARELNEAAGAYPGWILDRYLQLPDTVPARVANLARDVTRNAITSFEKASALEEYLHSYTYDKAIQAPPPNADGVDYFLFESKRGYSDYFASTFVVMARSIGLPSRMVVGYAPGTYDAATGLFVVKDSDSHGWPEVYFPGYGWIEFEPTPGKGSIPRGQPLPKDAGELLDSSGDPFEENLDFPFQPNADQNAGVQTSSQNGLLGPLGYSILAAMLAIVVGWFAAWYWYRRVFVRLSSATLAYDRMSRLGSLAGARPGENQTPSEYAQSLGARMPSLQEDIATVAGAYARSRYGKKALSDQETSTTLAAWGKVRKHLVRRVLRRR